MKKISFLKRMAAVLALLTALFSALPAFAGAVRSLPRTAGTFAEMERITSPEDVKAPSTSIDFTFIRVLISTGGSSRLDLGLRGEYYFEEGNEFGSADTSYPIRITKSGSTVKAVSLSTGETLAQGASIELKRVTVNYLAGYAELSYCGNSDTLGRKYLGDFTFSIEDGALYMVNTVPMTYYIYGIVGYELNIYCQPEALKAQALAAQSFGMYYMDSTKPYDVKDGWTSALYQAYRGYREDRLATMPYCYDVLGEAISYGGSFKPIFYGHTNGGETALPSHIFGGTPNDAAYGVAIDQADYESNNSIDRISVDFGGTGDNSRFRDFILCKISDIYEVEAVAVDSIGDMLVFEPLSGTQRNMQKLRVTATVELNMGDKEPYLVPYTFTFECPTSEMRSYVLRDLDGSGDNYSSSKYVFTHNYLMYWGIPRSGGYTLIFARYGHGIGLSQMGAETRANPDTYGWDYHRIIEFYYPNFTVVGVTMTDPDAIGGGAVTPAPPAAYGVSTVNGAGFYSGASTGSQLIGTLAANEHIDILGVTDTGWYSAVWNGNRGYISMDESRLTMFPSPHDGVFHLVEGEVKAAANLRAEPYIRSGNVISVLPAGTRFVGWTHLGKWYYIVTEDGRRGFLSSLMANFTGYYDYVGCSSISAGVWLPPNRYKVSPDAFKVFE